VLRPGERRRGAQLRDVVDLEPDVDEAAVAPPRLADADYTRRGTRKIRADGGGVEARRRARVERRPSQRVQRRERAVDVHGRRTVEREIDLFLVLVLAEQRRG